MLAVVLGNTTKLVYRADEIGDETRVIASNRIPGLTLEHDPVPILSKVADWVTAYVAWKKRRHQIRYGKEYPADRPNSFIYDGGGGTRAVVKNATQGEALAVIYGTHVARAGPLRRALDATWYRHELCQAVRNRLRVVESAIAQKLEQYDAQDEVRIVSIACGLAPAVLHNIAQSKVQGRRVVALLVDKQADALESVMEDARKLGIASQVQVLQANVLKDSELVWREISTFAPHIGEAVGLIDYLDDAQVVALGQRMRQVLSRGGMFVTANIMPNRWQLFLQVVVNWRNMKYRTVPQLKEVFRTAGFAGAMVLVEPWRIFQVAIYEIPPVD